MIRRFWRVLKLGMNDEQTRQLFLVVFGLLVTGTVFYSYFERWSVIDSLYFSVVALTTVGFGDFSPERTVSKIFTIFYLLTGVSVLVAFGSAVLRLSAEVRPGHRRHRRAANEGDESAVSDGPAEPPHHD